MIPTAIETTDARVVEEICSTGRLEELVPEWEALWRSCSDATPFQSPHWILPYWKRFGSDQLFAVAVRRGGELSAFAPLYILRDDESDESLGLLIGTGSTDYLDVLVADRNLDDAAAILARMTQTKDLCQVWDLQQLRPTSLLLATGIPQGWSDATIDQDSCPILRIDGAGPELENLLSTHARKRLRYYSRAVARNVARNGEIAFESATSANLDELLAALFELHAARWRRRGLPGVLADDLIQDFHREVAPRMLAAGALRMYAMRAGGRIAAIFYGFAHHDTVYYYLSGYDPDLERLSVGTLIVAHAIEEAVRDGACVFDFLRGAEEYKYAWGATDRVNQRRQLFPAG